MTRRAVSAIGGVITAAVCLQAATQDPPRQVFRSGVDLVTVMVYVVDDEGRPVRGLTADDFRVELNGQRRPVRALDYREMATSRSGDAPSVSSGASSVGLDSGGRVFMLLFDDLSFLPTSPDLPALRESLARMVARLTPQDRIGLATTSGRGPTIAPTVDHARVSAAVRAITGRAPQYTIVGVYVSVIEAIEIIRDRISTAALKDVADRECRLQNVDVFDVCEAIIEGQARIVLDETRDRTAMQLRSYEGVLGSLAHEPSPRILVLVSDGLATGSIVGFTSDLDQVSRAAAEANTQLYTVVGDRDNALTTDIDRLRVVARSEEVALLHDGIESIVSAVGGGLFRLVGSADRPFTRILEESSGVYEIGVDAPPGDDVRLPEVVVSVDRPGVTVRANRRALVPAVTAARPIAEDEIARVLRDGGAAVGVPMSVATSFRRAPNSEELQLAVDLSVPDTAIAPLEVAFAIVDGEGRAVKSGSGTIADEARDGEYRFTFSLPLPEGRYALRLAVADPDGRVGGLEHPVTLALQPMGRLLASNLLTGWVDGQGTRRFLGLARLPPAAVAADVALELYTADRSAPSGSVSVRIDLGQVGAPRPFESATFEARPLADRWQLRTSVPVDALEPGLFTLTATVLDGGAEVGSLTTTLEKTVVEPDPATARPALPSREAVFDALAGEVRGIRRRFDSAPFLSQALTRAAFRDVAASTGESLPPELEAQVSADDAWWAAVGAAAREPRSALGALARGLQNLRVPNAAAAVTQFELALERAPASAMALLYLGAGHAASGQDVEAAGAWQFALGSADVGLEMPLAQVDALVRIGDWAAAGAELEALQARFPDSRDVLVRQVEVGLADGRVDETRPRIARLLEMQPDDTDALWWQVVVAFGDAVVPDQPQATERFLELAAQYLDRDAPRSDLVRSWIVALSRSGS